MREFKTRFPNIAISLFAFLFGLLLPALGFAAEPLLLSDGQETAISLRPYIGIYEDRSGQLTFGQIRRLEQENPQLFKSATHIKRVYVYPDSSWWLRATIENRSGRLQRLSLVAGSPNIEQVSFYLEQQGEWQHTRAGTFVPLLQQQDGTRVPNLLFELQPGEIAEVLIQIKSRSPFRLNPVLYSRMLFRTASLTSVVFDGILIGAMGALAWSTFWIYIVARRQPFLWLAGAAAVAGAREAATRGYIQRFLWPLESAWGYRLELSLDVLWVALGAMFVHSVARHGGVAIPGSRAFTIIGAGLLACTAFTAVLPVHATAALYQIGAMTLAVCALGTATLLTQRSRFVAALLGSAGIFCLIDAAVRTIGSPLAAPLFPVSLILESGTPPLALLATGGSLAILSLWAAQGLREGRRRGALMGFTSRAGDTTPADGDALPTPAAATVSAPPRVTEPPPADATMLADESTSRQAMILGYVGHDLRAPLATISGYTRLLRQAAAPAQHAYLDVIERSIGYQFSLIDEILAYSKAELQPFSINPEETDLPALLEELARFGIALCVHHGNSFQYVPAPTLPAMASLDRKRLRQATLNLLGNAAKFTREGIVRFEARVQQNARWQCELHLQVFNDGPTIAVEDQCTIFSAFRQLRRRESGVGLGLFIVERIAHAMGGTVRVESSPEARTCFSLVLPIHITDASAVVTRSIHHVPTPESHVRHVDAPPLTSRLALARLARDGELSEIEKWIQETRAVHPRYTAFYDEVVACIENFDMEGLQRLALLGVA